MNQTLKANWLRGACAAIASLAMLAAAPVMATISGAIWTTGNGQNSNVNQNIFTSEYIGTACNVFLNGGPAKGQNNNLTDGLYYFQVTEPNPNPSLPDTRLLSTAPASARTISVVGGIFSGIPLCDFLPTLNAGGEYKAWLISANCSGTQIDPNDSSGLTLDFKNNCAKTDNFKIIPAPPPPPQCTANSPVDSTCPCGSVIDPNTLQDPRPACATVTPVAPSVSITKDAQGSFDEKWTWTISKSVTPPTGCAMDDSTPPKLRCAGTGSVTFPYTVTLTSDGGTAYNTLVTGNIYITAIDGHTGGTGTLPTCCTVVSAQDVTVTDDGLFDTSSNADPNLTGVSCVGGGNQGTLTTGVYTVPYSCSYAAGGPAADTEVNQAELSSSNASLPFGSTALSLSFDYTVTDHDDCVNVTDALDTGGTPPLPATVCVQGTPVNNVYQYTNTVSFGSGCQDITNTAAFTSQGASTNATPVTGSSSKTVRVCGVTKTGGLTMGFWQNKNGQGVITHGASTGGVCNAGTALRAYNPFQDLSSTASCTTLANYVMGIIKTASAAGASMNAMLKAQMLATALDVYYSGLSGNPIGPFNGNVANIGSEDIDLSKIWGNEDVRLAFGGANHMTVSAMLSWAGNQAAVATTSNSLASPWYGQVKTTQGLAKDAFDAINNGVVIPW